MEKQEKVLHALATLQYFRYRELLITVHKGGRKTNVELKSERRREMSNASGGRMLQKDSKLLYVY